MIVKADHEIYKDLKDAMARQQSLGTDSYPKTLSEAMEILHQNQKRKKRSKSQSEITQPAQNRNNSETTRSFALIQPQSDGEYAYLDEARYYTV